MREIILIVYAVVGVVLVYFGMVRNTMVLRYRLRLIRKIAEVCMQDTGRVVTLNDFTLLLIMTRWRYEQLNAVSYGSMVLSLRRFDSFFPDKSFLEPMKSPTNDRPSFDKG